MAPTRGRPLAVAIAGTGFIGRLHARAALVNGASLVGVSSSTPDRAVGAAQDLGAARAYRDSYDMVTDPDIDVVHICTPNHIHAPLARAALDAGKHVICEKPLATTIEDALDLYTRARDKRLVATVPFVFRYYPMAREARVRTLAGQLGRPTLVQGVYLQDWLFGSHETNWRVDPALGGPSRTFADIGSHWCDLAEFVTGDLIVEVASQLDTVVGRRPDPASAGDTFGGRDIDNGEIGRSDIEVTTEDNAVVQFRTAGGMVGSVVVSQVAAGHKNHLRLELMGSRGSLAFDSQQPDSIRIAGKGATTVLERDPRSLSSAAAAFSRLPAGHPQGYQDCVDAFVAETYRAVRGDRTLEQLPTFASGLRAAAITEAVMRAAAEHRWVTVPEPLTVPDPLVRIDAATTTHMPPPEMNL